jgi:hypothetical protein
MTNVYHFRPPRCKPSRSLGKYDRLQQPLLRRAQLRAERSASPWDELTSALVMENNRCGTLNPGIVEAFLVAAGLPVPQ